MAALTPRAEIEGEMGDLAVGSQARLMSQAMRKITGNIGKSGCTVIFLNQLRLKIGVTYGNPETTTGGNALKFYASVRLDIRRIQTLKKGTEEFGIRAKVKVAKNKVAPPFRIAEFDILFGRGISTLGCLLDLAEETGVVVRKGAWYSYEGDNIGQGRDNTINWMEENSETAAKIEELVRQKLTEGSEVKANSMRPLAALLRTAAQAAPSAGKEEKRPESGWGGNRFRNRLTCCRSLMAGSVQHLGHPLKLLDGIRPFQFHQFAAIAGFNPADAEVGDQEANDVAITQVSDEGCSMGVGAVAAAVAAGCHSSVFQAFSEGLQAHHQIVNNGSVVLSETGKHA